MMYDDMAGKQKQNKTSKAKVLIPNNMPKPPEPHEVDTAWVLARFYDCEIQFVLPTIGYHVKSVDILLHGALWEIKSPVGDSKTSTIKNQFENAKGKSKHLIIDGRRSPLDDDFMIGQIRKELRNHRSTRRLLFITKDEKVLVIK